MPNNNAYGDTAGRLDFEGGATGTQRHRPSDPTGEPFAKTPKTTLRAETRGGQYRKGGWDKYELPTDNDGPVGADDLPEFFGRGGNAGAGYNPADYPGGTTA
jgi:hypothetical protein